MTKKNNDNQSDDHQNSYIEEEFTEAESDQKGLFGSAHKLATFDDTAAQLFKELTGATAAYERESAEVEIDPQDALLDRADIDHEHHVTIHKTVHQDTFINSADHSETTYTANPAFTTGAKIDPRVADEGIPIPLAPVYQSDRIALILAIIATALTLIGIFFLPGYYAGNLSETLALLLVLIPGVIALISILCAIPGLISQRHLP